MRTLKLSLVSFVLVLSGCATQSLNPWDGLTTETGPAVTPLDCGQFPVPSLFTQLDATYDQTGLNDLNAYRVCSEANEALVTEHALQIGQLKLARKGLTEAGRAQRNIADMRQTMLEDERKHNFFEKIGLYVLVIGLGVSL